MYFYWDRKNNLELEQKITHLGDVFPVHGLAGSFSVCGLVGDVLSGIYLLQIERAREVVTNRHEPCATPGTRRGFHGLLQLVVGRLTKLSTQQNVLHGRSNAYILQYEFRPRRYSNLNWFSRESMGPVLQ